MTEYEINAKDYQVEYDLDNRITKVDVDNSDVEYRYDAFGRRVIRQEGSTKSALIWWGNSECAEHKHQAGQTVIQNDIMEHPSRLNSVIARAVDGSKLKLQWYHKNYLDHVYAVSDDDGDILEHYRYTAFGEVTIYDQNGNLENTTQIDNHILWNTRRRDEVTGFYMYKFRHYAPELGRWPSRDPIEENGGVNLYGFVGNDPVGRWDELGLIPDDAYLNDNKIIKTNGLEGIALDASSLYEKYIKILKDKANKGAKSLDRRFVFIDTQYCILQKLSAGACCTKGENSELRKKWLNHVVGVFMGSILNAFDGKYADLSNAEGINFFLNRQKGHPSWKPIMDNHAGIEPVLPNALSLYFFTPKAMATIHIGTDLKLALSMWGVGTDEDWKCIGKIVAGCSEKYYNKLELTVAELGGKFDETFDVIKFRDEMRKKLKASGVPEFHPMLNK